jgi:hypothetical protein
MSTEFKPSTRGEKKPHRLYKKSGTPRNLALLVSRNWRFDIAKIQGF